LRCRAGGCRRSSIGSAAAPGLVAGSRGRLRIRVGRLRIDRNRLGIAWRGRYVNCAGGGQRKLGQAPGRLDTGRGSGKDKGSSDDGAPERRPRCPPTPAPGPTNTPMLLPQPKRHPSLRFPHVHRNYSAEAVTGSPMTSSGTSTFRHEHRGPEIVPSMGEPAIPFYQPTNGWIEYVIWPGGSLMSRRLRS